MSVGLLAAMRLVEFDAMGPVPFAAKLLSDLGADILRIARAGSIDRAAAADMVRNRPVIRIDLKTADGRDTAFRLIEQADGLLEGFRPGVMERLGLGPDECLRVNPQLVYVRMTGWGQYGPLAHRAGHDLNYIAITGALRAIGEAGGPPPPPLNLLGDYGGGATFAVIGLLASLLHAREVGQGQVVDVAMVDGVAALSSAIHGLMNSGQWLDDREANTLDGAAPYYQCYTCADGKFISVAALEPEFFALLLEGLGLDRTHFDQRNRERWPDMKKIFADAFASRTRDEWAVVFDGTDACVAPVLSFSEARSYPHNVARGTYASSLPTGAPRFSVPLKVATSPGELDPAKALARWSVFPEAGHCAGRRSANSQPR